MMTAALEGGKLALSFIPNVEIVTLLCAVYGFVFGWSGIVATYLFVGVESLIWGFNTWVITYLLYWPLVTFCFLLLGRRNIKNRFIATLLAVALTAFFGVLSSLVDAGLLLGFQEGFFKRFAIIYVRGVVFYVIQMICNLALFLGVFRPIVDRVSKIYQRNDLRGRS
ncbi:MAG: hypothetical protein K2G37_04765 [Clostridia bacterium]|nr:hypothetical protein [Clostridia bacterium]MDE7328266.1 hypothetical protein [Clostridia bacterium]